MRAVENFPISGVVAHPEFIKATAQVKKAAALANMATGALDRKLGEAIVRAADEVIVGQHGNQFVIDVFQAGAGTSHNMNANEVLANRATELLGSKRGNYTLVNPHDHVNMSQSTNDVYPTIMRVACLAMSRRLIVALKQVELALRDKAAEFDQIVKSGRTHLQDAAPIRLGQEFMGYAENVASGLRRIEQALSSLLFLNIGGSAVGTGLNADPAYMDQAVRFLSDIAGFPFKRAKDHVAIMQSMSDFVELSGAIRALATDLIKVANDFRLLSSGPVTGIAEITLPPVQPGSSIMPGKFNPVIAEAMNMVCFQAIGNDLTVTLAAQAGQLELNVMMPVIAYNLTQSIEILTNMVGVFTERLVKGIKANEERCRQLLEKSAGIALALNPYIGYDAAAQVAKEALTSSRTLREVVLEKKLLSKDEIERILDPYAMTQPGAAGKTETKNRGKSK